MKILCLFCLYFALDTIFICHSSCIYELCQFFRGFISTSYIKDLSQIWLMRYGIIISLRYCLCRLLREFMSCNAINCTHGVLLWTFTLFITTHTALGLTSICTLLQWFLHRDDGAPICTRWWSRTQVTVIRNAAFARLKSFEGTNQRHEHHVTIILTYNLEHSCSEITDGSHRVNDKLVYYDVRDRKWQEIREIE
jgi:hypothetical protein